MCYPAGRKAGPTRPHSAASKKSAASRADSEGLVFERLYERAKYIKDKQDEMRRKRSFPLPLLLLHATQPDVVVDFASHNAPVLMAMACCIRAFCGSKCA